MDIATGVTLGGPRPGMVVTFEEFRPVVYCHEPQPVSYLTAYALPELEPLKVFQYRAQFYRSLNQIWLFYLPDGERDDPRWDREALFWIWKNGTESQRLWAECAIEQRYDKPQYQLIRIPADRVAEILGLTPPK